MWSDVIRRLASGHVKIGGGRGKYINGKNNGVVKTSL